MLSATDDAVQHAGDAAQLPGRAGGVLAAVDGQPRRRGPGARLPARHAPAPRAAARLAQPTEHLSAAHLLHHRGESL